jgi:hypothetical protein
MESKETEELRKEFTHCTRLDTHVWKVLEITEGPTEGTEENTTKNYEKLAPYNFHFQSNWSQILQMIASEV